MTKETVGKVIHRSNYVSFTFVGNSGSIQSHVRVVWVGSSNSNSDAKGTWECKCKLCIHLFIFSILEAPPTSPEYLQYIAIAVSVRVRNEGCSVG
jgi:hypothetical protein